MASNLTSVCQPCSRIDESVPAKTWCIDCTESLCLGCTKAHKTNKATMKHNLIGIDAATSVPFDAIAALKECPKHPSSTNDFYCTNHETLCCRNCMTNEHRSCDKIVSLEDACQNIKKSSIVYETTKDLKHLLKTLQDFKQKQKQTKENVRIQKTKIEEKITQFKQSLIQQLDKIEILSLSELDELCCSAVKETDETETITQASEHLVGEYLQQIEFMTEFGSNQLLFTLLQTLQLKITSERNTFEDIKAKTYDVDIMFEHDENLLQGITKIGLIKVNKTPCEIKIIATKDTAAQDISFVPSQQITSFTPDYDVEGSFDMVSAIAVDKDNYVLLADQTNLKMYNQQGKYIKQCKLNGTSWDLSCHKTSNRIVVALQTSGIQIIDDFIPQSKIPVPKLTSCYGITFINDNIVVCGVANISLLDYNGKHIKTITTETKGNIFYLHHHQSKLYFTDFGYKVYGIKEDGTKLQTMTKSGIGGAEAVTTDHKGNLYVAGRNSNNVVRLSEDGTNCEEILKKEFGITSPYALCFSRDYTHLFVSFRDGKAVKAFRCEY